MRTWIQGGSIITPDLTITDSVVLIEDSRISTIAPRNQLTIAPTETEIIDADGLLVMPGLIDIHVHGGGGSDTMDATSHALEKMSNIFLQHGVTAYLATTASQSFSAITEAVDNVAQYITDNPGARPIGMHLEGPYLCNPYRGAHIPEWLRNPDPAEYRRWLQTGVIRLMTVAPELPGVLELIREGAGMGVRFSAGHTQANPHQIRAAVDAGLSLSTHTFNGMAGLHHRDLGTVGALLADDRVYCEIIADGTHVHPDILKLLLRIKSVEHTILITDAIRATGQPDGEYDLAGQFITVNMGMARTIAGGLAGSTLTLDRAVHNIQQFSGISINQAIHMATVSPAAVLGLLGSKGEIRPGADADILIADTEMNVKAVMVSGKVLYRSLDFFA